MSQKNSTEQLNSEFRSTNSNNNVHVQSSVTMNVNHVETDSEIEERLANIFKQLDRNGNGRIDIQELTAALKDLGMSHQYAEVIY